MKPENNAEKSNVKNSAKRTSVIDRIVEWLEEHGYSAEEINDCIDFITKKKD